MEDGICVTKEVDVEVELSSVTGLRGATGGRRGTVCSGGYAVSMGEEEDEDEEGEIRVSGRRREKEWPLRGRGETDGDEKRESV